MRISDWSSDVCSSDLLALCGEFSQALLEPTEGTKIIASSHRDIGTKTQRTQLERRTDFLFEKSRDTVCAGTEIPCQSQVAQAHQLDARTLFRRGLSNLGTKRFDQRRRLRPWRLHVALLDFDDPRFQVWVCPHWRCLHQQDQRP